MHSLVERLIDWYAKRLIPFNPTLWYMARYYFRNLESSRSPNPKLGYSTTTVPQLHSKKQ